MAQTPSIPQALHSDVVNWWLTGLSPRDVKDRLFDEHGVVTSHASVLRVVRQVADGHADEVLLATVTRLRLRSMTLMDQLEENLSALRAEAGLEDPSAETPQRRPVNPRLLDLADRITIRHLRLAGIGGRASERLVEKYEAQQRQLGDARCAMWGVSWPFQNPSQDATPEEVPANPPSPPVAVQPEQPRTSPALPLLPPSGSPPVNLPPELAPPGSVASPAADSVRMGAKPSALVAEKDASASGRRPAPPLPRDIVPAGIAPRRPCPCGSGLRFKHCHGKPQPPSVDEPAPRPITCEAA